MRHYTSCVSEEFIVQSSSVFVSYVIDRCDAARDSPCDADLEDEVAWSPLPAPRASAAVARRRGSSGARARSPLYLFNRPSVL